jgi:hypothetical protein
VDSTGGLGLVLVVPLPVLGAGLLWSNGVGEEIDPERFVTLVGFGSVAGLCADLFLSRVQ